MMAGEKYKLVYLVIAFACVAACAKAVEKINIYLPREVEVKDSRLLLGSAVILQGDEKQVSSVEGLSLGSLSEPGQVIRVDRNMILSRLASNGLNKKYVEFSGAEYVEVKLKSQKIDRELIIRAAEKLLEEKFAGKEDISWKLWQNPDDIVAEADSDKVEIKAEFARYGNNTRNQIVKVSVLKDGELISQEKLRFDLKYKRNLRVAKVDILRGSLITRENVEIKEVIVDDPASLMCAEPYGLEAKRDIKAGETLRNNYFGQPKPEKLVKRNQTVIVMLKTEGFVLTVPGTAEQDGFEGDLIKVNVKVTEQERIIVGRVLADGTIEPSI